MKKLHLIIICILYSLSVIGQQSDDASEVVQLSLPKGTRKLSQQEYNDFMAKRYDKSGIVDFHNHVYQKNNLLIYYFNSYVTAPKLKKSLESNERIMLGVFKQYGKTTVVDTATIITVNNIRFGLIKYHKNDIWYIRSTSDYDNNLHYIRGFIEYKKSDQVEAEQYLRELLQSMHFRNEDVMGKP